MGVRLVSEVLEHAPAELTSGERLLLVVLAEDARDDTRTCWPSMDLLKHKTGLSPRGIRDNFAKLAARGYEVRIPLGTDKNGNSLFAVPGKTLSFKIPTFPERELPRRHSTATIGGTPVPSGGTAVPARRHSGVGQAAPQCHPSPHPSDIPSNHTRGRARDDEVTAVRKALLQKTGKMIDDHWAKKVIEHIIGDRQDVRNRSTYLVTAIQRDPNPARFLPTPTPPVYGT